MTVGLGMARGRAGAKVVPARLMVRARGTGFATLLQCYWVSKSSITQSTGLKWGLGPIAAWLVWRNHSTDADIAAFPMSSFTSAKFKRVIRWVCLAVRHSEA